MTPISFKIISVGSADFQKKRAVISKLAGDPFLFDAVKAQLEKYDNGGCSLSSLDQFHQVPELSSLIALYRKGRVRSTIIGLVNEFLVSKKEALTTSERPSGSVGAEFLIEGPWNVFQPVHEVLTLLAIRNAMKGLRHGNNNIYPRITSRMLPNPASKSDLQFFHGMADRNGEHPRTTRAKILRWAIFLVDLSISRISLDTKLKDQNFTKKWFTAEIHQNFTMRELFCYRSGSDIQIRQRAAGALLHLIQDSYAAGHVLRQNGGNGNIIQFHVYGSQDSGAHKAKDKWADGETLSDRVANTTGAAMSLSRSSTILTMINGYTRFNGYRGIIMDVLRQIFTLDKNALPAGPGDDFEK